ncbi:acyltransferase [Oenococcus sp. UCMA 17063]|nr:acyltransferase [Oenococcus sp. UCMA 17063]
MNKQRQSNFELLRVFAMLLIVFHHVDLIIPVWPRDLNFYQMFLINFFGDFGKVGVNLFVLITGYFMCNKKIRTKNVVRIWIETVFYGWLTLCVGLLIGHSFQLKSLLSFIFPVLFSLRWFATAYLIVYLFIPFLNPIIKTNKAKNILFLFFILLFVLSIMPTIRLNPGYSDVGWLIFVYLLGGFFAKYSVDINRFFSARFTFISSFIVFFLIICVLYLSLILGKNISIFKAIPDYLMIQNSSFLSLIFSILIFFIFLRIKIQSNFINFVASLMFGIYLFHAPVLEFLISKYVNLSNLSNNGIFLILYLVLSPIIVFCFFGFIEFLRIKFLGNLFFLVIGKIAAKIDLYIEIIGKKIDLKMENNEQSI